MGYDRAGKPQVKRRTARRKLRSALLNFKTWCKENHHRRLADLFTRLNANVSFAQSAAQSLNRWENEHLSPGQAVVPALRLDK